MADGIEFGVLRVNIVLPSTPGSSNWSLSFRSLYQNPACTSTASHTCHMPSPSHSSWFDHPNSDF